MDRRRSALFLTLLVTVGAALCALAARPAAAATDPERVNQPGLAAIKAPEAWARGRGAGVSVAIVSTGIAEHPDLEAKVDAGFDATGTDARQDTDGSGTHLAGIVGAATDNDMGIAGVAPEARLLPFKAFDGAPDEDSQLISALTRVGTAKAGVVLVDVPSGYESKDELRQALKALGDAGTSVVVGVQSGLTLDDLPVLVVASSGAAAGPRGVAAPGSNILSTTVRPPALPTGSPIYDYGKMSGSGQAAAHVAGAVAILRGLGANATQAADLLRSSAGSPGKVIDVAAAATAFQTPPPPPATTTTTAKPAAKPAPGSTVKPSVSIPPGQVVPSPLPGEAVTGDPDELGEEGGDAVVPPGAEAFGDDPESGRVSIRVGGKERPWGSLTVGFGLLFGVGTGLSLTFRRLADAPI